MKPIIGITVEPSTDPANERSQGKLTPNWNYTQVIADAGGVPLLIPPTADPEAVAQVIDGWLIPGGLDIDAGEFGEENHPEVELQDPARFASERALLDALPKDVPIFGICYGCQFLNVAMGGSLVQHIPDVIGHNLHSEGTWEQIRIDEESQLGALVGQSIKARSYHHQAIDKVGQGLRATAISEDGIVEAVEATDRPWTIAVQWHPERSYDDDANRMLIESFVAEARRYAEHRKAGA